MSRLSVLLCALSIATVTCGHLCAQVYTLDKEDPGYMLLVSMYPEPYYGPLTELDYIEVAEELGVEVPALKAVVEIETGARHQGFWKDGKPLINFDLTMFRKMAQRNHVSLTSAQKTFPVIFSRPNISQYGSQQAAQQARLDAAMEVNELTAIQATFWGMFQIGGFNWKKCGAESAHDFVERMSRSERDQLELFAKFIINTGLVKHLAEKNWAAFARGYNGPGYARKGYHTRMANAYKKFKTS